MGYRQSLEKMLLLGGDTDTNCCILGGLIGAVTGVEGYEKKVMEFEGRPKFLLPKYVVHSKVELLIG